jgi:hypothetical protein
MSGPQNGAQRGPSHFYDITIRDTQYRNSDIGQIYGTILQFSATTSCAAGALLCISLISFPESVCRGPSLHGDQRVAFCSSLTFLSSRTCGISAYAALFSIFAGRSHLRPRLKLISQPFAQLRHPGPLLALLPLSLLFFPPPVSICKANTANLHQ